MNQIVREMIVQLLPILATTLTALATLALARLNTWLKQRAHIELKEATRSELNRIVKDSIAYAEERANQIVKAGGEVNGDIKKTLALEFALARSAAQKAGPARIESIITAQLGQDRIDTKWLVLEDK